VREDRVRDTRRSGLSGTAGSRRAEAGKQVTAQELETLLGPLRAAGRTRLSEREGLAIAERLGLRTPALLEAASPDSIDDLPLADLPGERVVLKVASPEVVHKSDRGGVEVVAKSATALVAAARRMAARFAPLEVGFLCEELVEHDAGLGGELLLSYCFTDELGPIVSLAPGGLTTEHLDAALLPERRTVIASPSFADRQTLSATLSLSLLDPILRRGLRGQPPRLPEPELLTLLESLLHLARIAPGAGLLELELNPVALVSGRAVALDATGVVGPPPAWDPASPPVPRDLTPLLRPRSMAVLGVSRHPNPGRRIVLNSLDEGFDPRRLWIVKPGDGTEAPIEGCPTVPSIAELPETVDLLVLALDAVRSTVAAEEAIRERRARSLVLVAGGFGEGAGGEENARRVLDALAKERAAGREPPIVVGGNCLGVRSQPGRCNTLFVPRRKAPVPEGQKTAPLALLSQSGALVLSRTSHLEELAPRLVVTLGNQLDLTLGETLESLDDDADVRVVAYYVEGFRPGDGLRFLRAAAKLADDDRAVILYRAGRTAAGSAAAASHTASLAGDEPATSRRRAPGRSRYRCRAPCGQALTAGVNRRGARRQTGPRQKNTSTILLVL
jgi:acyl-CoA synthetase (NDP forming)